MTSRAPSIYFSLSKWAIAALCTIGCQRSPAESDAGEAPTTRHVPEKAEQHSTTAALAWRTLYELRGPKDEVLLFDRAITAALPVDLMRLAGALGSLAPLTTQLDQNHKIILQNDVWGLLVRLDQANESSQGRAHLSEIAGAMVRDLALEEDTFQASPAPLVATNILSEEAGWYEVASELPALNHELAYGSRRLFRLFRRRGSDDLALASHLLALASNGATRRSDVIGEVEILHFDGDDLSSAEVYELDRLNDRGPTLHSLAQIVQIPGQGADSLLAEFDPPEAIAELPCLRCHHDGAAMSLPSPSLPPRWRDAGVLQRAQRSAGILWPGLAPDGRSRR